MSNMPTLRDILNDDPADATDVEWNFNTIETHIDTELINRDGSVAMTGALNLVAGAPTLAAHATRKDYVDGLVESLTIFERAADVSLTTSVAYDVVWDTETADPDTWGATGSANLTCPATGLYLIGVSTTSTYDVTAPVTTVSGSVVGAGSAFYITTGAVIKVAVTTSNSPAGSLTHCGVYIARLR